MDDTSELDNQTIKQKLTSAKQLINWNRRLFSMFGLDPIAFNNAVYSIIVVYMLSHLAMTSLYLPIGIKYKEQTIDCMTELIGLALVLLKLLIYKRKAPVLARLLQDIAENVSVNKFKSEREVDIFIGYISLAKIFFKISNAAGYAGAMFYYIHTFCIGGLHIPVQTDLNNVTTYLPPYRIQFFCPLTDLTRYIVAAVYLYPIVIVTAFVYVGDGNMLVVLVAHVCSQLSILSRCYLERIGDYPKRFKLTAADAVRRNYYVMKFVRDINLVFSILMLQQRVCAVFALCLFLYGAMASLHQGDKVSVLFAMITVNGEILIIFAYSYVGQCLIDESLYLNEALCKSAWYNLKSEDLKYYLILHAHMQKPLFIDCGSFFVFSLDSFVTMMKSTMAYLSVLNAIA